MDSTSSSSGGLESMTNQMAPSPYYPAPFSTEPLDPDLRRGLIAPAICGLLSVISTTILLGFIISRFFAWKAHYRSFIGYNQYIVLIMNLLIADLQQGMSFLVSFQWIKIDGILAPTRACFAQGWLINIGDVSSGFFVFFIAFHTFYCAVKGQRLGFKTFTTLIILTWVLSLLLTSLGPLIYREKYFVRAGAWCWASSAYERERLALHYIWVFMVQFGTVLIYVAILIHLRKTISTILPTAAQTSTVSKIDRAAKIMVVYPIVYIALTLPLSAGRMWSMAHGGASLPNAYSCLAGALIASTGFVDALLYTLTRKQIISGSSPDTKVVGKSGSNGWFKAKGSSGTTSGLASHIHDGTIIQTRTVTVVGGNKSPHVMEKSRELDAWELEERDPRSNSDIDRPRAHFAEAHASRPASPTGSAEPMVDHTYAGMGYGHASSTSYDDADIKDPNAVSTLQLDSDSISSADDVDVYPKMKRRSP